MAIKMINGVATWVPDTDGGLATYSQNRYNMDGLNGYGGMDTPVSNTIVSNTPSVLAKVNAQNELAQYTAYPTEPAKVADTPWTKDGGEAIKDLGNTSGGETSWWSDLKGAFTPQGDKGTSLGGNMVNAVGTGVNAAAGLAGMYFAKKNYDLQKDNQDYLRNREAQSDARKSTFAANAGNGATY